MKGHIPIRSEAEILAELDRELEYLRITEDDAYFFMLGIARKNFTRWQWEKGQDRIQRACRVWAKSLAAAEYGQTLQSAIRDLAAYKDVGSRHPFFSEAVLYPEFGKDMARSILSRMRQICHLAHIGDLEDVQSEKPKAK